jgi:hypothetical protein
MSKHITEEDLEDSSPNITQAKAIIDTLPQITPTELLPATKQRINNTAQKEEAMHYLGLTRKKYMRVIIDALEAYKWADVIDRQGNVKQEWVPDIDKQRWGAEQAAKLFGDYIQHVDANIKVSHSVEELLRVFDDAKKRDLK